MRKCLLILLFTFTACCTYAQVSEVRSIHLSVTDPQQKPLAGATVSLFAKDSVIIRSEAVPMSGAVSFNQLPSAKYRIVCSFTGFTSVSVKIDLVKLSSFTQTIVLAPIDQQLGDVTVVAKKSAIQFLPDKTVINPDASITNAGATVMDVLQKSPGVTVSKDGSIIMKGKPSVMVLIDGKQTQLNGADLQAYLSGMSASQVDVIELIENPGAKYDAAGNAGIINIKTKTNRQKGFNGSVTLSKGQGFYQKTNGSINMNYRNGKLNWFLNYGVRNAVEKQNLYTLRRYVNVKNEDSALLEQPNFSKNKVLGNNIKTGFDFFASNKTTLGLVFNGGIFDRKARNFSAIQWMSPNGHIDSIINTAGDNNLTQKRGGVNFNARHKINSASEVGLDIDYVRFQVNGDQDYQTNLAVAGSEVTATQGNTRSKLQIFTAKADYSHRYKNVLIESGLKTAINTTNNLAQYYYLNNNSWLPDYSRSNHFLYDEKISAAYASADAEQGKWHWQVGLRYEITSYKAHQLGNAIVKDSAFKRNYGNIFPTGFISYQLDSNNIITARTGRRIDRPQFQNLNPFIITLNKYTFEAGNPFIKPQYTWNFALAHTYKQKLTSEVSYSYLKDYFSQIFIIDSNSNNTNKNIIIYTRGNVGSFQSFGITETFHQALNTWWNLTAVAVFNRKIIKGVVWAPFEARVSQLNVSLNNQFQFKKGWAVELSGYYQTRSQIDLQEWLKPQGQLDFGVSKQILKNKGSLRFGVRDMTKFQNYSGYSTFQNAYEPFRVTWDSRVATLSFNWRFGKAMKAIKRSEGGATEEINRAGN